MIFDLVVLAVFFVSCLVAFLRGLIRETLTIIGLVGGLLAGWYIGPLLAPLVRGWLHAGRHDEPRYLFGVVPYTVLADALAYGSIFLIVVILLTIVSYMLSKSARAVGLGAVDRSLGVLFGMVRAVVLLGLLYLPVYMLIGDKDRESLFGDSRLRPHVETVSAWMSGFLPESWKTDAKDGKDKDAKDDTTRGKLEALEVLRPGNKDVQSEAAPDAAAQPGYEDTERRDMQDLIGKNLNQ